MPTRWVIRFTTLLSVFVWALPFAAKAQVWTAITDGTLQQVSVGGASQIVGVNQGNVWKREATGWNKLPGALANVAVGSDGALWGVNASGLIYRWTGSPDWAVVNPPVLSPDPKINAAYGTPRQIAVVNASNVYLVTTTQYLFRWTGTGWTLLNTQLYGTFLAAAMDGTVMIIDSSGAPTLYQATATGIGMGSSLPKPPAPFVSGAVGSSTNIWGLTADDRIFRFSGGRWVQVEGALRSIAAASDGTVIGANAGALLYRFTGGAACTAGQTLLDGKSCVTLRPWGPTTQLTNGTRIAIRLRVSSQSGTGGPYIPWPRWLGIWEKDNQSIAAADTDLSSRDLFYVRAFTDPTALWMLTPNPASMPWYALMTTNDSFITYAPATPPPAGSPAWGKRAVSTNIDDAMMFARKAGQEADGLFTVGFPWKDRMSVVNGFKAQQYTAVFGMSATGLSNTSPVPSFSNSGLNGTFSNYDSGYVDFFVVE